MYKYYFEKLTVWQDAKDLVVMTYKVSQGFPKQEMYGLASQLQRAAVSITANISDGSSRNTPKDQANFSTMAYARTMEVLNLIIIAQELGYIDENEYMLFRQQIDKVANKINALRKKQKSV